MNRNLHGHCNLIRFVLCFLLQCNFDRSFFVDSPSRALYVNPSLDYIVVFFRSRKVPIAACTIFKLLFPLISPLPQSVRGRKLVEPVELVAARRAYSMVCRQRTSGLAVSLLSRLPPPLALPTIPQFLTSSSRDSPHLRDASSCDPFSSQVRYRSIRRIPIPNDFSHIKHFI